MKHLSEDEFSELLAARELAGDAQVHLAACVECRAEMERVRGALDSFNAMGMEWAERRSATLEPVRVGSARSSWLPVAWVTAMALVVAVSLGGWHSLQQRREMTASRVTSATTTVVAVRVMAPVALQQPMSPKARDMGHPTVQVVSAKAAEDESEKDRIARDNQLLEAISSELSSSDTLLVPSSELKTAKRSRRLND